MDIRNIKDLEKIPIVDLSHFNKLVTTHQNNLILHYIQIEKIPTPPVQLNVKDNQTLIKDFSARVVEELGEMYESYEKNYVLLNFSTETPSQETLLYNVSNINEELSDAFHFMYELLIYAGFNFEIFEQKFGRGILEFTEFIDFQRKSASQLVSGKEDDYLYWGGRFYSRQLKRDLVKRLWDITYKLQMFRNTLKNKAWKQTELLIDRSKTDHYLEQSLLSLFETAIFLGHDLSTLYYIYRAKNQINNFRIQSKY